VPEKRKTVVVALGGNAITQTGQRGTTEEQLANISNCCDFIADLAACGYGVVLTHGNGPQVGNLLIQNECGRAKVPENPMDVCVAQTQGSLGYLIAQTLQNRIRARGMDREVAAIMTQVVVDPEDPAFRSPSKPVGPFFTEEEARTQGHPMVEDSGRGYRRVVPSPRPKALAERDVLKLLVDAGVIVIAVGGGGIPVTEQQGGLHGAEAVVDKDFASALVAKEIGADSLMLLTGVPKVAIHFGTPLQQELDRMTVAQAQQYMAEGQFPAGSMGPKIQAAMDFVSGGGGEAIVTSLELACAAMEGKTGTRIVA
jgi:carbamate kinase